MVKLHYWVSSVWCHQLSSHIVVTSIWNIFFWREVYIIYRWSGFRWCRKYSYFSDAHIYNKNASFVVNLVYRYYCMKRRCMGIRLKIWGFVCNLHWIQQARFSTSSTPDLTRSIQVFNKRFFFFFGCEVLNNVDCPFRMYVYVHAWWLLMVPCQYRF